jgi:hypothetical protein
LKVVNLLSIPKEKLIIEGGCPNSYFASDHFPILAEFDYDDQQ